MKTYLITICFFIILVHNQVGYGQCQNATQYPLSPISVYIYNTPKTIAANNYAGDYAEVQELAKNKTYSFNSSNSSDYITIRSVDNSAVLAQGLVPVSYTSLQSDLSVNIHINTDVGCGTETVARITTVTCTNCDPEPGKTGINTETPQAILDINGEIRVGKTGLTPIEGMIRYDSDTKTIEGHTNGSWKNLAGDISPTNELQMLTKNGDTIFLSSGNYVTLDLFEKEPFLNSSIISASEGQRINEWIGNKDQKWERCYQKTIDGATSADFHSNCDFKGESVVIIKLDNGRVFGGYTGVSWSSRIKYIASNRSFLFSMDNNAKYPIGYYPENAIYCQPNYGPTFGNGHDIYVNQNMNLQYINFPYCYSYNGNSGGNAPSDAASQKLAGINLNTPATIDELEVWVKIY